MLLDMEISQKVCKVVPYTNAQENREYYTSDSEDDSDVSQEIVQPKKKYHKESGKNSL
jgi:hypothetical protein